MPILSYGPASNGLAKISKKAMQSNRLSSWQVVHTDSVQHSPSTAYVTIRSMPQIKNIKRKATLFLSLVFTGMLTILFLAIYHTNSTHSALTTPSLDQWLDGANEGFAQVRPGWKYDFPDDHGSHPAFPTESWYFNGHLRAANGQQFAFQLNFFRLALSPEPPNTNSAWATNQVYRAHLAITDVKQKQFHATERFSRAALKLAGAERSAGRVWLENWEMIFLHDGKVSNFQLRAGTKDTAIDLNLKEFKSVIFGNEGLANMGQGNARFHAYIFPRLAAQGQLTLDNESLQVEGWAWLDRAWGEVPLSRGQIALNRFILQLDDNREIMVFQLRRRDGSGEPINRGLIVLPDGTVRGLRQRDLELTVLDQWKSPRNGSSYPAHWRLKLPTRDIELEIVPLLTDQELDHSIRYWAGGVVIAGQEKGRRLNGHGHVELTGYAARSS